jgi:urease accessory protein
MLVADTYVGHREDDALADRLDDADPLTVTVDDTERRRSRVRTTADDGTDLGIVVARELRDGDVLAADDRLVVVSLARIDALVVYLRGVAGSTDAVTAAVELGHAAGNRHWDLTTEGDRAYLPLVEQRERMESEISPHLPEGATMTEEAVSPALFDEGDGGHNSVGSGHGGYQHDHSHDDESHDHTHGNHRHGHAVHDIDTEGDS